MAALVACQPIVDEEVAEPEAPSSVGVVSWVYDGDTIEVTTESGSRVDVRLVGLNAPDEGECHHRESLDHMIGLLADRRVSLTQTGIDQFGRTLAVVQLGDRHINLDLVAGGHAIATTPEDDDPHGAMLLSAEDAAREAGLGLWAEEVCGAAGPTPPIRIDTVDPDPPGPDEERLDDEMVVLVNDAARQVDMSGWVLRDESSRHRYRFGRGTVLGGGETLAIISADPGWDPGAAPVWNNRGDLVMLLDAHGRVVDAHRYPAPGDRSG